MLIRTESNRRVYINSVSRNVLTERIIVLISCVQTYCELLILIQNFLKVKSRTIKIPASVAETYGGLINKPGCFSNNIDNAARRAQSIADSLRYCRRTFDHLNAFYALHISHHRTGSEIGIHHHPIFENRNTAITTDGHTFLYATITAKLGNSGNIFRNIRYRKSAKILDHFVGNY